MSAETVFARKGFGEHADRGSRFLGYARRVADEPAFEELLAEVKAEHPKARHHCWAWRFRDAYRFHDDGEPGGTAGRPILQVLEGAGLTQAAVVVVRYFGGVKLGTGGLVRAYAAAAARAVEQAGRRTLHARARFRLRLPFELTGVRNDLEAACPSLSWGAGRFDEAGWEGEVELDAAELPAWRQTLEEKGRGRAEWRELGTYDG